MRKEWGLIVSGLSFIVFVYLLSLLLADKFKISSCGCPKMVSHNFVYIFVVLAVIFIVPLIYYIFSLKIDTQQKIIKKNIDLVMSFLDSKEKKILNEIINSKGKILQSQLTKKFGKLQTHRVIQKLKENKIIDVVDAGKTNEIALKPLLIKELVK